MQVNAKDMKGQTPLHLAALRADKECEPRLWPERVSHDRERKSQQERSSTTSATTSQSIDPTSSTIVVHE